MKVEERRAARTMGKNACFGITRRVTSQSVRLSTALWSGQSNPLFIVAAFSRQRSFAKSSIRIAGNQQHPKRKTGPRRYPPMRPRALVFARSRADVVGA